MNEIVTTEDRIASKIDTKIAGQLQVSAGAGGISFANASEVMEFAKMMAISDVAVPKHLRKSPGACLGIILQSIEWKMSPFAVANKSYMVNDRLAYEAQLIHAVALQRAPIKGRFKFEFSGEGATRRCRAWTTISDEFGEETVDYTSPMISEIKIQNSPLWKSDPDQQLTYYSVRALCRRHFPDVLMGIFAPDEFDNGYRAPKQWTGSNEAVEINVPEVQPHASAEDAKLQILIANAETKAQEGSKQFAKWLFGLDVSEYARIEPHLDRMKELTTTADQSIAE